MPHPHPRAFLSGTEPHGFARLFALVSRQRRDLIGLRVKLPPVTTSLTTQGRGNQSC